MKTYTKETLIQALQDIREQGWIPNQRGKNDGAIGNTLEDLLGIEENNLPLPNASEWELKSQRKGTTALITLFHTEPSPRAYKFVASMLLPDFGWRHKNAGTKYPDNERSFRQTIHSKGYSGRGFRVRVDRDSERVLVDFNYDAINLDKHFEWANALQRRDLTPQPYWGFDDLYHKAATKLHNCFFIQARSKRINGVKHFHYEEIHMLRNFDKYKFVTAIEDGGVHVDFDARTRHNHGTKFRLRRNVMIDLYDNVDQF